MGITLSQRDTAHAKADRPGQPVIRSRRIGRRLSAGAAGVAMALGPIACSADQSPASAAPAPAPTTTPSEEPAAVELTGNGTLMEPGEASNAFTYDPALAPAGAKLTVTLTPSDGATTAKFAASGLLPNRGYAVHLHTKPCGPTGDAAGPHFQYEVDPAATPDQPSTDPQYANPRNEIWLDVRTDATGSGKSIAEVPFVLTDRAPESVVVHEAMTTATEHGEAGTAGDRLACVTLQKK